MKKFLTFALIFLAVLGVTTLTNRDTALAASCKSAPTSDECKNKCVESSILHNSDDGKYFCDEGDGDGIYAILNLVLDIFTYGVGTLGVIGIVISGIQYLTAADNEQKMAKAKKRIIEVVIGLAIYAVLYLALKWLLPGGITGDGS